MADKWLINYTLVISCVAPVVNFTMIMIIPWRFIVDCFGIIMQMRKEWSKRRPASLPTRNNSCLHSRAPCTVIYSCAVYSVLLIMNYLVTRFILIVLQIIRTSHTYTRFIESVQLFNGYYNECKSFWQKYVAEPITAS